MSKKGIAYRIQAIFRSLLVALLVFTTAFLGFAKTASAYHPTGSREAGKVVQERAEQEFDRKAGAGTINQLEGDAQKNLGKAQRQVDRATGQAKGAARQGRGEVQKGIGRTQGAAEDAKDAVGDSAENLIDNVKDFFGQ